MRRKTVLTMMLIILLALTGCGRQKDDGIVRTELANHKGYSFYTTQLFQALCVIFDVDCYLVGGKDARDGCSYWNMVNIGGKWYHADASQDAGPSSGAYRYFLVSDSTISKERTVSTNSRYSYPTCPSNYR